MVLYPTRRLGEHLRRSCFGFRARRKNERMVSCGCLSMLRWRGTSQVCAPGPHLPLSIRNEPRHCRSESHVRPISFSRTILNF